MIYHSPLTSSPLNRLDVKTSISFAKCFFGLPPIRNHNIAPITALVIKYNNTPPMPPTLGFNERHWIELTDPGFNERYWDLMRDTADPGI
jgi:hypothetical protein